MEPVAINVRQAVLSIGAAFGGIVVCPGAILVLCAADASIAFAYALLARLAAGISDSTSACRNAALPVGGAAKVFLRAGTG